MPLTIAIIGAGTIGPRHAESVMKRSDCSLFAIVDRSPRGSHTAHLFGCPRFASTLQMFEYCDEQKKRYPDAAIVCTPNDSHAEIGMLLATRGVHMIVEKPLAATAADCIELIRTCEAHNVRLLVGHHRRFNPYLVATKENMHRIGRPVAVQGLWALKKDQAYFDDKPWHRSRAAGGGTILINLIHDLDLLQYLLGPISRVFAELLPQHREAENVADHVDEGAALTLRFKNGCCGTFLCSDNVISPYNFESGTGENPLIPQHPDICGVYRIFGSEGTLCMPDLTLYHQNRLGENDRTWFNPVAAEPVGGLYPKNKPKTPFQSMDDFSALTPPASVEAEDTAQDLPKPFDLQLDHFVNLITGAETTAKCSGYDALQSLLCIEAVMKSIEEGVPQMVQTASEVSVV